MKTSTPRPVPLRASLLAVAATAIACAQQPPAATSTTSSPEKLQRTIAQWGSGTERMFAICWQGSCPRPTVKWLAAQPMDDTAPAVAAGLISPHPDQAGLLPARRMTDTVASTRTVFFTVGNSALSPQARRTLQHTLPVLLTATAISIVGHTDRSGSLKHNRQLAHQRAQIVKTYLLAAAPELASRLAVESPSAAPGARVSSPLSSPHERRADIIFQSSEHIAGAAS